MIDDLYRPATLDDFMRVPIGGGTEGSTVGHRCGAGPWLLVRPVYDIFDCTGCGNRWTLNGLQTLTGWMLGAIFAVAEKPEQQEDMPVLVVWEEDGRRFTRLVPREMAEGKERLG